MTLQKQRRKIRFLESKENAEEVELDLSSLKPRAPRLDDFWPLDAPGMPPPGEDFLNHAKATGDDVTVYEKKTKNKKVTVKFTPGEKLQTLYRRALREPGFIMPVAMKPGSTKPVMFIPGHLWGQQSLTWERLKNANYKPPRVNGPVSADVMILGKMPWTEEARAMMNLVGPSGEVLKDLLEKLHIKGARRWYITNLCKFMPPGDDTRIKAGWIKDCLPLLHQELRLVRPKYILCLGADASKALLGAQYGVGYMEGRVVPLTYPVHRSVDDEPEFHTAFVMTVLHPAEAAREPPKARIIERGLARFNLLTTGARFDLEETGLDHRTIDTYEDAVEWVQEVNAYFADKPYKHRLVAMDAEWEGQHPMNPGSYLRTMQFAWAPKHAVCFKLAHQGGKPAFRDRNGKPAKKRLMKLLNRFMRDKRTVGHFTVSDLEWMNFYGFDPVRHCKHPLDGRDGKQAWELFRDGEGWLDLAMAVHAVEETASLGLESVAMRYTTAPRYDIPVEDWKKEYCKKKGIKPGALEGYGDCPDKILIPYANYDADVTLRGMLELLKLLDLDYEGNNCWEPFWESMIIQPVILTIHKNGILVDKGRIDELTTSFLAARKAQETKIKEWANWPEFNIRSVQQVKEFLFGEQYNGKVDKKVGGVVRIRPKKAKSLKVRPLLDTSKPPRRWDDLEARKLDKFASPSTGKTVLGILAQDNIEYSEQINWLRDYRFLDQVLKSILRPPVTDEDGTTVIDDDGFAEYEAGLASCIDVDGRVRTHLYPTAETARWKSSRPNLQNISKSRDPDYERLLGRDKYAHKLRSVLMASKGYAFVEFDYKGAELYGMAIMAGDANMISHAERSLFPDEGYDEKGKPCKGGKHPHPQYYDIHSNVAVLAFQLRVSDYVYEKKDPKHPHYGKTASQILGLPIGAPCPATKYALKIIGKSHFRTLAKNVIFGIAYGRGAKAIALQAREQKVNVTPDEAQIVIDAIFTMYPNLLPFFEDAKTRATEHKWLRHCFGRYRRFATTSDYKLEGEFERQAMNFPIQGMIASAVDRGLARLHRMIFDYEMQDDVRLLLQMHDAALLEVRYHLVPYVVDELIPYAMRDCVPIYPTTLDGEPTGTGPYYLGLDTTVEKHWGEKFSREECERVGLDLRFAG